MGKNASDAPIPSAWCPVLPSMHLHLRQRGELAAVVPGFHRNPHIPEGVCAGQFEVLRRGGVPARQANLEVADPVVFR